MDPRVREIVTAVQCACRFDVLAYKPGNVSMTAAGHGMTAVDFLNAARLSAPLIADPKRHLGAAIESAVIASVAATGCNTNLGIILLLAPLVRAALQQSAGQDLHESLCEVLRSTEVRDAAAVYRAIRVAQPAGLGKSTSQDVADEPSINLLEVMRIAAVRDRIAFQYACDFEDVFERGLPRLRCYRDRWQVFHWACVGVYLHYLCTLPDSHIARKHGDAVARDVQAQARALESDFKACENPAMLAKQLAEFDRELKNQGVNPGTSADLTVATVFVLLSQHT